MGKEKVGDVLRYDVFVKDKDFCCFENTVCVYILNHAEPNYRILELSENYAICHVLNRPIHHVVALPRNQIISQDTWDILRIECKDRTEAFQQYWDRLFSDKYKEYL